LLRTFGISKSVLAATGPGVAKVGTAGRTGAGAGGAANGGAGEALIADGAS
jgi:hypothetical protein